jgi:2-oxoglutarate dehydrogenase complex dehydrogenase (E1) component-like enzyme
MTLSNIIIYFLYYSNNLATLINYSAAETMIFAQEEPRNCGAWSFVKPRLDFISGHKFNYAGRPEMPTSATGNGKEYKRQMFDMIEAAFN